MLALPLSSAQSLRGSLSNKQYSLSIKSSFPHPGRTAHLTRQFNFLPFTPLRVSIAGKELMKRKPKGFATFCSSAPLSTPNLQWLSTISTAVLMLVKGTAVPKSFLIPLFALQAPSCITSWIRGEYGTWTAFLALLVRLFFYIPGELKQPFIALLLVIVSPNNLMNLRGRKEGAIFSLVIAAYLAFQHFSQAGSLQRAFEQGSIVATLAIICLVAVPCLLLI